MVLDIVFITAPILNSDFQMEAIPKDDLLLPERRRDLQKEVELAKRNLAQQVNFTLIYTSVSEWSCSTKAHQRDSRRWEGGRQLGRQILSNNNYRVCV